MANEITGYDLSRAFFNWCFENPEKISPTHIAMYFFIIEHCNRLGWKEKFGLPTIMVKDAIGIRNFRTYKNTLNDLCDWGFIRMVEKSKNQYSSNIIAIVKNAKAHTNALTKATQKQVQKQSNSIATILKQEEPITNKPITIEDEIIFSVKHLFDEKYLNIDVRKTLTTLLKSYTRQQITEVIVWARNDPFWSTNFLSINKLKAVDKQKVKYIDIFLEKMQKTKPATAQAAGYKSTLRPEDYEY